MKNNWIIRIVAATTLGVVQLTYFIINSVNFTLPKTHLITKKTIKEKRQGKHKRTDYLTFSFQ